MRNSIHFINNSNNVKLNNFYFFCSCKNDFVIAKKKKNSILPELNSHQKKEFNRIRNKILVDLLKSNQNNNVFLSSPLGCNNDFQSDFYHGLENLFKLYFFLKNNNNENIFFTDPIWFLTAKEYLRNQKISINFKFKDLILVNLHFLYYKLKKIYNVYNCFRYMRELCIPANKFIKKKINYIDIIFFSIWQNNSLKKFAKTFSDPFFSDLPKTFKSLGKSTAIFCHINDINKDTIKHFIKIKSFNTYSYFNIIGYKEIIKILCKLITSKIIISNKFDIFKRTIISDMQKNMWTQSCEALLINECILKFISKNKRIKILHTYEGNCWEKGCYMDIPKLTNIFGYQHTAFPLNQHKLSSINPLTPKSIITTGNKSKEMLSNYFFHKDEKIFSGYNLRSNKIYSYNPKSYLPIKIKKILILLQGDVFDEIILEELRLIRDINRYKVLVRSHPLSNLNVCKNSLKFFCSKKKNIYDDIKTSDVILFHRTSAALESVFLGVPVLFFNIRNCREDNPLINLKNNIMMNEMNTKQTFEDVFKNLQKNRSRFKYDLKLARKYYKMFFNPRTKIKENQIINFIG